jgi:hypothetical protein
MPDQQAFHQHLRAQDPRAVRTVLELVMREELDAFIGAAWGESSPKRKGFRNGTYTRDLVTTSGRIAHAMRNELNSDKKDERISKCFSWGPKRSERRYTSLEAFSPEKRIAESEERG